MGFLSSLFQSGAPVQQVAGPTIATQKLPEELAPYYKDILGKAQALYNERTKEGYQPYQGPTIADFTPEQQQAFTGLEGLVGSQAPVFQEGMDLTRSAAAPMTSEQMTQYMSPYQQAVTDIEKREATKQYESQVVPALAAKAATTGGFGGSRQAILESMAADTQQRLLSDIQAKGSQQAYQDAVKRFQADRQAAGQAGAQLATMAPQQFKAQLGELGALQTVGEQKQRQQQTALDEAFRQYQLERNYPYDTMSKYQAVVTGAPVQETRFAQPTPPPPSTAQTLISGLGTLGATYGAFTGQNPLSLLTGKKHGGGLSNLPVVNAQDSTKDKTIGGLYNKLFPKKRVTARDLQDYWRKYEKKLHPGAAYMVEDYQMEPSTISNRGFTWLPDDQKIEDIEVSRDTPEVPTYGRDDSPIQDILNSKSADGVYADSLLPGTVKIGSSEYPIQGGVSPVENISSPESLSSPSMPKPIERDLAGEARFMSEARLDKKIGEQEKAYLDSLTAKQGALDERAKGLEDERIKGQYGNLAKFFARMGTVSPRKGGLMGIVDAGLQVAPESIDAMNATNEKIRERREVIQDKKMDLDTLLRKEELGMTLSGAERNEKRRLQKLVEKNTEKTFELEEKKLDAEMKAAGIPDEIKDGFYDNVDNYINDFTKDFIGLTGKDGETLIMKGEIKDYDLKLDMQMLKARAVKLMAEYGSHDAFIRNGGRELILENVKGILDKYSNKPIKENQEENQEEQTKIFDK